MTNKVAKGMVAGSHGSTFGGNQLACSVALAVINEVSKKKLSKQSLCKRFIFKRETRKKLKKIFQIKFFQ